MSGGPWEDFQQPTSPAADGPWSDYAAPPAAAPAPIPPTYTPDEKKRIAAYAKTAPNGAALRAFAEGIGHDRGLSIGNADEIIADRNKGAEINESFLDPPGSPPPPPPPPDTSFGHDAAVAVNGVEQGAFDIGNLFGKVPFSASLPIPGMGQVIDLIAEKGRDALNASGFGQPQTPGQSYLNTGARFVAGSLPSGVGGGVRQAVATGISGLTGGLASEATKQAGYGRGAQIAAGLLGALVPGAASASLMARVAPETVLPAEAAGPSAFAPPRGPVAAFRRVVGGDNTTGARVVARSLADDAINPRDAGRVMAEAQANGTPIALADLGENTRALAASVARNPGAARTLGKTFTKDRQLGQIDRVRDAINRDIGPTTDVLQESENLVQQARQQAAPLYQAFHALPARTSPQLEALLATPAGKAALARARTIALNDRVDPNKLGFDVDAEGGVSLAKSASPQTLDYVKQGLDEVLNDSRSQLTGKLVLGPVGRSVEGVRSAFVQEMDRLYPGTYKAAREAYAGPAALNQAMLDGKAALNKSASEIRQRLKNMSPAEAEQYGLGLRSAMADALGNAPDGANKVRSLIGNPKRREVLNLVFGGRANLDRFVSTLENEQAAFETYQAIHGGSPTQPRAMEDAANSDTNILRRVGSDLVAVGHGPVGITARVLERGANLLRYGAGKAGQRAREDAASLLFSTSPLEFDNALGKITLQGRRDLYRRRAFVPVVGGSAVPAFRYQDQ